MPSSQAILENLMRAANEFVALSVAWHVALLVGIITLLIRRNTPSQRTAFRLMALPTLSVGIVAWRSGSPFNALTFLGLTAALLLWSQRPATGSLRLGPRWAVWLGSFAIGYAAVYPHFVVLDSAWLYAVAAPLGVVPCPSLSLLVGTTLIADGLASRGWSLTIAVVALTYALVGIFALGVHLDIGLLIAAVGLLGHAALRARGARRAVVDDDRERIEAFLALSRIALVGAATDRHHFSRIVMAELTKHGIDVVPVHLHASVIAGRRAFGHVAEIDPPVQGALLMTPAAQSCAVVEECAAAGIRSVWLHRGFGVGAVSEDALQAAERHHLRMVVGRCPLMFLGNPPQAIHRVHASLLRVAGRYPEARPH